VYTFATSFALLDRILLEKILFLPCRGKTKKGLVESGLGPIQDFLLPWAYAIVTSIAFEMTGIELLNQIKESCTLVNCVRFCHVFCLEWPSGTPAFAFATVWEMETLYIVWLSN
jgi:hypothetical protein